MMLMSSMGPAGIAIGVAIDEGISKELHSAFSEKWVFSTLVEQETERWVAEYCQRQVETATPFCKTDGAFEVLVHHYGFVTRPGENDPVVPKLDISFTAGGKTYEHLLAKGELVPSPLTLLKQDGDASKALLLEGYRDILDQLENVID